MEESPREVTLGESVGAFEEAVGLVGIGKVGARHNHVAYLLRELGEHGGRRVTGGAIGLHEYRCIVDFREFTVEEVVELKGLFGIGLCPLGLFGLAVGADAAQLGVAVGIKLLHLGGDEPRLRGVGAQGQNSFLHIHTGLAQRLAVG